MKNILTKKDQSAFVIYGVIQSSAANFLPYVKDNHITKQKYAESVKYMLESLKKPNNKSNDKNINNFEGLKTKLFHLLDENKQEEFKDLVTKSNYDPEDLVIEIKQFQKIIVGENASDLNNSESSTKIEKIEASFNKGHSSRNFNLTASINKHVVIGISNNSNSRTDTLGSSQDIRNDISSIKYSNLDKVKLPYLKIGVVITLSNLEIKRIFIDQMQK